jgi:hypothetical protein
MPCYLDRTLSESLGRVVSARASSILALLVVTIVTITGISEGATINAASCSRADVEAAVQTAADGDTVVVPSGTCTWASTLTIRRAITLQGAGIDLTIIVDEVPRGGSAKATVLIAETIAGKSFRLTGFTIKGGSINTQTHYDGAVIIGGISKAWRVDHVKFSKLHATSIQTYGETYGVIDHNVFDLIGVQAIIVWHEAWGGASYGDGSWADAAYLGTEKAIFIEDNVFTQAATIGEVDCTGGGRYVFRHNTVNSAMVGNHGTETTQRVRSCRSLEIYNNTFTKAAPNWFTGVFIRGGTGVIFNNTFTGYTAGVTLNNFRSSDTYTPWGKCDGSSPYDGNTDLGYPCIDQPGRGKGLLLSGSTPTPASWPQQAPEPIYAWNNVLIGASLPEIGSNTPASVREGRDFFNKSMPGYQPFTYPHPLVGGGLAAPGNLTVK